MTNQPPRSHQEQDLFHLHHLLAYRPGHQPTLLEVSFTQRTVDKPPYESTIFDTPDGTVELPGNHQPVDLLEQLLCRYPVPVTINEKPLARKVPNQQALNHDNQRTYPQPYIVLQGMSYHHSHPLDHGMNIVKTPDFDNEQPLHQPTTILKFKLHIELPPALSDHCHLTALHDAPQAVLSGKAFKAYEQLATQQYDHALAQAGYPGDYRAYQSQQFVYTWDSIVSMPKPHAKLVTIHADPDYYSPNTPYSFRYLLPPKEPIAYTLYHAITSRPDNQYLPVMLPIDRNIRYPDITCEGITFTLANRQTIQVSQQHFEQPPAASIPTAPSTVQSVSLHIVITDADGANTRTTMATDLALLGTPKHEVIVFTPQFSNRSGKLQASLNAVYRRTPSPNLEQTDEDQFEQREQQRLENLAIQAVHGHIQAFRVSLINHWNTFRPYQPMPDGFDLPAELANLSQDIAATPTPTR